MGRAPMITFPCPNCGAQLRAAPQHAGTIVSCWACGQPAQAPNLAITAAPTGPSGAVSRPPTALTRPTVHIFYESDDVLVTDARLSVGDRHYPLRYFASMKRFRGEDLVEHSK